jgi:alkylhydroperoxidase family enzyme
VSATEPRIHPLSPPYEPDVEQMLAKWMPPGSPAEPLRLFRTMAVHNSLAGRMRPLGAGILGSSATVEPRLREVMIHRTCALTGAEYEWGVHAVAFGGPLGFTSAQLDATVTGGAGDEHWSEREAAVFALADELHETSAVSDELWARLSAFLDEQQLFELIVTAGWYHTIAYVCNALRVEPEEWARPFPAPGASVTEPASSP